MNECRDKWENEINVGKSRDKWESEETNIGEGAGINGKRGGGDQYRQG